MRAGCSSAVRLPGGERAGAAGFTLADVGPATGWCSSGHPRLPQCRRQRHPDTGSGCASIADTEHCGSPPVGRAGQRRGQTGCRRLAADAATVRTPAAVFRPARQKRDSPGANRWNEPSHSSGHEVLPGLWLRGCTHATARPACRWGNARPGTRNHPAGGMQAPIDYHRHQTDPTAQPQTAPGLGGARVESHECRVQGRVGGCLRRWRDAAMARWRTASGCGGRAEPVAR
jgi:hypothetical protein